MLEGQAIVGALAASSPRGALAGPFVLLCPSRESIRPLSRCPGQVKGVSGARRLWRGDERAAWGSESRLASSEHVLDGELVDAAEGHRALAGDIGIEVVIAQRLGLLAGGQRGHGEFIDP